MTPPNNSAGPSGAALEAGAYLARLSFAGPLTPTAESLRALHVAHLYAVPFENLDIGLSRPLSLALPALFDKIVARRRGGFCYELNGLFAWLLQSLGYAVTYLSVRVANADGSFGPEFDHLALWVECPADGAAGARHQRWLADVGFGDCFVEPLRLEPGLEQPQGGWVYWLEERAGEYSLWRRDEGGAKELQYGFTLAPRQFSADFEPMCLWQQTAPEFHFVLHRMCTLPTPAGRMTLYDRRWIVTEHGQRREQAISDDEFWRLLQTEFGVVAKS